ncbi:MAG TPA: polysaccharide deacetylase family protein [Candidatus Eisenbacteria bacterium]|nr:polysaccharide deacetylase family protein [Candidatus Eisenbacteria bacterium]
MGERFEGAVGWQPDWMLCRVEGVADRFAITFDDGPSARHSERVLEVLARHGAHATFFQLGRQVRRHPGLTRLAHARGHEIALHDDLHLPPPLLPRAKRRIAAAKAALIGLLAGLLPAIGLGAVFRRRQPS